MKYSEVTGPRALTLTADLIEAVKPLEEDPEVVTFLQKNRSKGEDRRLYGSKMLVESSTLLMGRHGDDLIKIFSIIRGVTPEQYKKQMRMDTLLTDVADLISDGNFLYLFFPSPIEGEKKDSGST